MDHLEELTGALIDAMAEAVTAGLAEATADHQAMRAKGENLRDQGAMFALLGPRLYMLARTILGEVERRSVPRFAAALDHVRYSTDAPVNELEDARRTLNQALLRTEKTPGAMSILLLAIAIVRVRAITLALGPECVAVPPRPGRKELRRRKIEEADIDSEVGDILVAMTEDDWDGALVRLHALEREPANRVGIVTSLVALAESADGHVHLNKIAARLQRARFDRRTAESYSAKEPAPPPRTKTAQYPSETADNSKRMPDRLPPDPIREGTETIPPAPPSSISARFRASPSGKPSAADRLRRSQERHARDGR